jgi:hypothetical protein
MAKSFLQLTNELLRESNEVILTSSNFGSATGIQAHAQDCINRSYLDIVNEEPKWPFLATAESGTTDPMYGNVSVETTAGTRWYELKPASNSLTTDYGAIDWENFYLTTVGVTGEVAPYVSKNMDDADTQNWGEPNGIVRSPDGRKFGLTPIPKQVYKVWFFAYDLPTALSDYSDEIVFPDLYSTVLIAKARYYLHQFKDNPQSAAFALDDYKKGLRSMRENLLDPSTSYFKDDRVVFI